MSALSKKGLEEATALFMKDDDIEALEHEIDFWLSVEECELCDNKQMCTSHYERMYATL